MALSSMQKGNIVESQIANLLMLASNGNLSPFLPLVDDAGIDLILTAKGTYNTLFLQIKSRFKTTQHYKNRLDFTIQKSSIINSPKLYVLCVYFNQELGEIETMWLIPSHDFFKGAIELAKSYRIVASRSDKSSDKWSKFKVTSQTLVKNLSIPLTGRWAK